MSHLVNVNQTAFLSMDIVWANMPNRFHEDPPFAYSSFHDYWLVNIAASHAYALHRGYHRTCQNKNCKSDFPNEMIGAHLVCVNKDIHLTVVAPLCRECNLPTNGALIEFPEDMPVMTYWGDKHDG